nr:shikimate O-hydroxycinnamoyltransferase-like [Tanacetum cinerariifolium]
CQIDDFGVITPSPELRKLAPTVEYSGDVSSYPLVVLQDFIQLTYYMTYVWWSRAEQLSANGSDSSSPDLAIGVAVKTTLPKYPGGSGGINLDRPSVATYSLVN